MTVNRIHNLILASALALGSTGAAYACHPSYSVKAGDTLFSIAESNLGNMTKWSLILNSNPVLMGSSLVEVPVGTILNIPCPEGTAIVVEPPKPVQIDNAELKLLTGGNYQPFTDQKLPGQGMVTELIEAALEMAPSKVTYSISWEDDWSKHLFPLLDEQAFDMGFPWIKPDYDANPGNERCANFHFSEPLMLMPIMLFVREDNQFRFQTGDDIQGRTICRPKGFFTHDLDRDGRQWITNNVINFVQADTPGDCFYQVLVGEADAASVNLFLGASVILEMGMRNKVVPLERPVSEEGLHVVISKRHWRGTAHLYRINAGLEVLKKDGSYQEIVSRHMQAFQSRLQ